MVVKIKEDNVAKETPEEQELRELREEIKCKRKELEQHLVRRDGGISKALGKYVKPIDKEIEILGWQIELKKIERDKGVPYNPTYMFEKDDIWRKLRGNMISENIKEIEQVKSIVEKQKEELLKRIKELEEVIPELDAKRNGLEPKDAPEEEASGDGV